MKKKYLVIGNPIEHSLSPKLHNYWLEQNNIDAVYDKKKLDENELKNIISEVKGEKINGINVTVPFKKAVIPFLDELSPEANETQSVNTIYIQNGNIIGHNTDIAGFQLSLRYCKYDVKNKKVFILGAGGVVPSIIYSLLKMEASKIIISNRTKIKANNLKNSFKNIDIIDWGDMPDFDMIINATTVGLKKDDKFGLDFSQISNNKLFYDVIYSPFQTEFSEAGNAKGNVIENGLNMFLFQGQQAFNIWHNVEPEIDKELIEFLKN